MTDKKHKIKNEVLKKQIKKGERKDVKKDFFELLRRASQTTKNN